MARLKQQRLFAYVTDEHFGLQNYNDLKDHQNEVEANFQERIDGILVEAEKKMQEERDKALERIKVAKYEAELDVAIGGHYDKKFSSKLENFSKTVEKQYLNSLITLPAENKYSKIM